MIVTAQLAYGNARVRARKSGLVAAAVLVGLGTAGRPDLTIEGWRDIDRDQDACSLAALVYGRLVDDYLTVMRAYPAAANLLRGLARLHELANVKLALRAAARAVPLSRWEPLCRPLGALETVSRTACAAAMAGSNGISTRRAVQL